MTIVIGVKADTGDATKGVQSLRIELEGLEKQGTKSGDAIARGAREGSSSMDKLKASTAGVTSELSGLVSVFAAFASVKTFEHWSDEYTVIGNKLRSVAVDQANLNGLLEATHGIAQDTRTDWESIASTYQRFSIAARGLGKSQSEVLDFTETLGKGLKLGGATAQESSMSMRELAHAFQTGTLTGREFKVLMKDATPFMHELQVVSGKTAAEFAEMGKHGKLTGDVLFDLASKAGPAISKAFEKTIPTIAEGFTMLKNEAVLFFGEAGAGSGVLSTLGQAMQFVVQHFETFGKVALGVGEALLGLYLLDKIVTLVQALSAAIAANPLGALLVALTVGISLLRQFGDEIDAGIGKGVTIGDVFRSLWQAIKDLGSGIVDFLDGAWKSLMDAFSSGVGSEGIEFSLKNVLMFMASFVDAAVAIFRGLKGTIYEVFMGLPKAIGEAFINVVQFILAAIEKLVNAALEAYNFVRRSVGGAVGFLTTSMKAPGQREDAINRAAAGGGTTADMQARYRQYMDEYAKQNQAAIESAKGTQWKADLSFKNPLGGSARGMIEGIADAINDAAETSFARDFVESWLKGIQHQQPAQKLAKVLTQGGPAEEGAFDEKAAKAYLKMLEQLRREWASLERQASPLEAANAKLNKVFDVGAKALGNGVIGLDDFVRVMRETALETEKARHPMAAWQKELADETALLGLSNAERERAVAIREAEKKLMEAQGNLSKQDQATIRSTIDAQRAGVAMAQWQRESRFGPNNSAYDEFQRRRRGLESDVDVAMSNIGRQIQDTASLMDKAFSDAFKGIEDALVQFVTTGKVQLGDLAKMLEQDLARLLIRQGENALFGPGGLDILPGIPGSGSTPNGGGGGASARQAPSRVGISPDVIVAALATDNGQEAVTNIVYKQNGARLATRARLRSRS